MNTTTHTQQQFVPGPALDVETEFSVQKRSGDRFRAAGARIVYTIHTKTAPDKHTSKTIVVMLGKSAPTMQEYADKLNAMSADELDAEFRSNRYDVGSSSQSRGLFDWQGIVADVRTRRDAEYNRVMSEARKHSTFSEQNTTHVWRTHTNHVMWSHFAPLEINHGHRVREWVNITSFKAGEQIEPQYASRASAGAPQEMQCSVCNTTWASDVTDSKSCPTCERLPYIYRRVYVVQYECVWSLSMQQWLELCRDAVQQGGVYALQGAALATRPAVVQKSSDTGTVCYSSSDERYHVVTPLDWTKQDFQNELDSLCERASRVVSN